MLFRRGNMICFLGSGSTGWAPNAARRFGADRVAGPSRDLGSPVRDVGPCNHLDPGKSFGGQSTFGYPVAGRRETWIALFDFNLPQNPIASGCIRFPVEFEEARPIIRRRDQHDLPIFTSP